MAQTRQTISSGPTRTTDGISSPAQTPAPYQESLIRLWREKRGETGPQDLLSDNLIVQLGTVTEVLNRAWYQRASGHTVKDIQKRIRHPIHKWMAATLDGTVEQTGAVFEAKIHAALGLHRGSHG